VDSSFKLLLLQAPRRREELQWYLLSLSKKMGKQRGEELEEIVIFPTLYGYYPSL